MLCNMHIGLGKSHLQIVQEGAPERPVSVQMLQLVELRRVLRQILFERASYAVPARQHVAALHPGEDPGDRPQLRDAVSLCASCRAWTDVEPAQFQDRRGLLKEGQKGRIVI